ncbi:MAG: hypothetical protein E7256_11225 [Lachnospiraceae bacterium]|nr:hypothetical protein [Lachnospiraceae bacterium]
MNVRIREFLEMEKEDAIPCYINYCLFHNANDIKRRIPLYKEAINSHWYQELSLEQQKDGSFGRFHAMDARAEKNARFPTTEAAILRMYDLMIPLRDPVVRKTVDVIRGYMNGRIPWNERMEKQFGYEIKLKCMAAANLNFLGIKDEFCTEAKKKCARYLEEMVEEDGSIKKEQWMYRMRREFDFMLEPESIYIIWLLYKNDDISPETEKKYLSYQWKNARTLIKGIPFRACELKKTNSPEFLKWLTLLEQFSQTRIFPELMGQGAYEFLEQEILDIVEGTATLPAMQGRIGRYHENWRKQSKRRWDLAARMTRLLLAADR